MTYAALKKLINNANTRYSNGTMTAVEYDQFKESTIKKMDVLLIGDRINSDQYEELSGMFIQTNAEDPTAE